MLYIGNCYIWYIKDALFLGKDGFKLSIPYGVDQSDIPSHHSFCFYSVENPPTNLTEIDEKKTHKWIDWLKTLFYSFPFCFSWNYRILSSPLHYLRFFYNPEKSVWRDILNISNLHYIIVTSLLECNTTQKQGYPSLVI